MAQSLWKQCSQGKTITFWFSSMSWKHIIHLKIKKSLHKALLHPCLVFSLLYQSQLNRAKSMFVIEKGRIFIVFVCIGNIKYSFIKGQGWFYIWLFKTLCRPFEFSLSCCCSWRPYLSKEILQCGTFFTCWSFPVFFLGRLASDVYIILKDWRTWVIFGSWGWSFGKRGTFCLDCCWVVWWAPFCFGLAWD